MIFRYEYAEIVFPCQTEQKLTESYFKRTLLFSVLVKGNLEKGRAKARLIPGGGDGYCGYPG